MSGCIFATKAYTNNGEKVLTAISPPQVPTIWRTSAHYRLRSVWEFGVPPTNFNGFSSSWLRYCSDVVHRRPTKLCTMFCRLLGCYTVYTFSEAFAPDGILSGANFILRPSLAFSYIGGVTARHSSSGRQPKFGGVVQGMELRNFRRGRHLYSAGQPSRWASAHILVDYCTVNRTPVKSLTNRTNKYSTEQPSTEL